MTTPMEMDYAALIQTAVDDIRFLQKLRKDVDPASCMSIAVRRGVPYDNDAVEDDDERRPWRTMPFHGNDKCSTERGGIGGMRDLIDLLIADRVDSLKLWIRSGAEYTQKICKADADAQQLLKDLK